MLSEGGTVLCFVQELHMWWVLIFWPWPTLRLASASPVCIRCAFPICTTLKPLYYSKVPSTAIFLPEAKLSKIWPLTFWLSFQVCSSSQEARWKKKGQKIEETNCIWCVASIFITSLQRGQYCRVNIEATSAPSTRPPLPFLLHFAGGALNLFVKDTWSVMVQSLSRSFCIVS